MKSRSNKDAIYKFKNRAKSFESLENRNLLAGNVIASSGTGALIIWGDNSANVITVTQVSSTSFKVAGAGTKVNGSNSAQTFTGVVDGIFINLCGGSDVLTLKNLNIYGSSGEISLGVMLGDGNDALVMTGVTTCEACAINGGSGNNAIAIDKSQFGYDLGIQTYGGIDSVAITHSTVYGALSVQLGDGVNALSMVNDCVVEIRAAGTPVSDVPDGFQVLDLRVFRYRMRCANHWRQ